MIRVPNVATAIVRGVNLMVPSRRRRVWEVGRVGSGHDDAEARPIVISRKSKAELFCNLGLSKTDRMLALARGWDDGGENETGRTERTGQSRSLKPSGVWQRCRKLLVSLYAMLTMHLQRQPRGSARPIRTSEFCVATRRVSNPGRAKAPMPSRSAWQFSKLDI